MCILLCSQHFLQFERNHLYHSTVITYFLYVAILSYSKGRMTRNTELLLQRVKEKIIKEKQQGTSFVCNQTDGGICGFLTHIMYQQKPTVVGNLPELCVI